MILMDYHLVFIVMSFVMLMISLMFLFDNNTPEKTIAALIICGINSILCMINYLSFYGIGLVGYDITTGAASVTTYPDMYPLFMYFFGWYWINIILIFYCWYKHNSVVLVVKETGNIYKR
jgi:hypothetical protein